LWPEVTREYGRLRARPGLIVAGLAAVGLTGVASFVARKRRRKK
jgi:LPXTG-motif cell wall-anchored protein